MKRIVVIYSEFLNLSKSKLYFLISEINLSDSSFDFLLFLRLLILFKKLL